ncbi:hypothetical protein [Allorhodopirellula heiligendammensis]|uniref:Uncharacterized protein n=1 Tax=Allorhodopirellula heiligendammensis TaxID=2714739 RepID=A0A5C6C5X4_9BACT|nr:hypothetical protein [Allorhodopirellula heiligendammensis]TWU19558.1 hypothetical protein Poly21_17320 [Allorhodopirellula heiligendammensis]
MLRALETLAWFYLFTGLTLLAAANIAAGPIEPGLGIQIVILWPIWLVMGIVFILAAAGAP